MIQKTKNILTIFLIVLLLTCCNVISAQQGLVYSHFQELSLFLNPAYAGNSSINNVTFLTRQQWVGLDGAPAAYLASVHTPLRARNMGVGLDVINNTIGPVTSTGFFLNYSYAVSIGNRSKLFMGLKGGINMTSINLNNLLLIDPGDPLFMDDGETLYLPNFGVGFHYQIDRFYLDFGIPRLLKNDLNPPGVNVENTLNREDRAYLVGGGYGYELNRDILFEGSIQGILVQGSSPVIDVLFRTEFYEKVGAGLHYRSNGSMGILFSYRISDLWSLGYGFDISSKYLRGYTSGTHEVMLGYDFEFTRKNTMSPRRF